MKARKACYRSCTCALAFFYPILLGALCRRTDVRFLHSSSSRQYVTVFLPLYRLFRSGGNLARRLRTALSSYSFGTSAEAVVHFFIPAIRASFPRCRYVPPLSWSSFYRIVLHGVPVLSAVYHTCGLRWYEETGCRAFLFPEDRLSLRWIALSFGERCGARRFP